MTRRRLGLVLVVLLAAVSSGCSSSQGGLAVGDLRTIARRVDGGGAECPLSIPPGYLRPSTVAADTPVRPDISNPSHAAAGTIASDSGAAGSPIDRAKGVRLVCRFRAGRVRVTLRLVGVSKGHAVALLFPDILGLGKLSRAQGVAFLDEVADLPAGSARPLPGSGNAAYASVAGDRASIGLVLSASVATQGKPPTVLPTSAELAGSAAKVARLLAR